MRMMIEAENRAATSYDEHRQPEKRKKADSAR